MRKLDVCFGLLIVLSMLVMLVPVTALAQEPERKPVKIYLVAHAGCSFDSFWCDVERGTNEAKKDLGVDVTLITPDKFNIEQTAKDIDRALAAKPDGLGVTVADPVLFQEPLMRAIKSGIPVIAYQVADWRPKGERIPYLTYIGQDDYQAGYQGGQRLVKAHKDKAKAGVCVNQAVGHRQLDARCRGFNDALKEANLKSQVLAIGDDPAAAAKIMEDFHTANPDVDLWLTLGPNGANPFYAFMKNAGLKAGDVFHGTNVMTPEIAERIKDGTTDFAIEQQPYMQGYLTVQFLTWAVRYGMYPASDIVATGPAFVDRTNMRLVKDEKQYR